MIQLSGRLLSQIGLNTYLPCWFVLAIKPQQRE